MKILLITINILGYLAILLEKNIRVNKTAVALTIGISSWMLLFWFHPESTQMRTELSHHFSGISEILFFLLGALTIVEVMDAHHAFDPITSFIATKKGGHVVLLISLFSFFLSGLIDNLTTTIVMLTIVRKLFQDSNSRMTMAAIIIINSNAGGAWSPIGDITTSMLWIGGQISALPTIQQLLLPSLISAMIPTLILSRNINNKSIQVTKITNDHARSSNEKNAALFLIVGLAGFISVPVLKSFFGAPPYLSMLLVLGLVWLLTEWIQSRSSLGIRSGITVEAALQKIDSSSILFFLGILLSVGALETSDILHQLSLSLQSGGIPLKMISFFAGIISAIIDNVPLLAAMQKMFDSIQFPINHPLWQSLAYCIGTGGSMLLIGSASGIVAMGMEKIDFFWYLKKISLAALIGYVAGFLVLMLLA